MQTVQAAYSQWTEMIYRMSNHNTFRDAPEMSGLPQTEKDQYDAKPPSPDSFDLGKEFPDQ